MRLATQKHAATLASPATSRPTAENAITEYTRHETMRGLYLRMAPKGTGVRVKIGTRRWRWDDAEPARARLNPAADLVDDALAAIRAGAKESDVLPLFDAMLCVVREAARVAVNLPPILRCAVVETREQGESDTADIRWMERPCEETMRAMIKEMIEHRDALTRKIERAQTNYVLGKYDPMADRPTLTVVRGGGK